MNSKQAKQIPIEVFLSKTGNKPVKSDVNGLWYKSPIRDGDNTASFRVNTTINYWYDFGASKGGTIIDLVIEMFNDNVSQALKRLSSDFVSYTPAKYSYHQPTKQAPKFKDTLTLDRVTKISEKALFCLLKDRCIDLEIAKMYLCQIYFSIKDKSSNNYALAMKNDNNAYEFKNIYMKGCIGSKSTTRINIVDGKDVVVFEGMMDFLAFLSHHNLTNFQSSVIILNSIELKNECLEIFKSTKFQKAYFFLDNDEMGKKTFRYLSENIDCDFIDKSNIYDGFKDYNDFLIETNNKKIKT